MWTTIPDVGKYGLITDAPAHLLPPGAWNSADNVSFRDGRVFKSKGIVRRYASDSLGDGDFYWGFNAVRDGASHWVYSSLTALGSIAGTEVQDLTRRDSTDTVVPYTVSRDLLWNGGMFNGEFLILNNGADDPQSWSPELNTRCEDLVNWPADYVCEVLKPFGYFLVAFNTKESGSDRTENRIHWSHPAGVGALPSSWDTTDATVEAGYVDLADTTSGGILWADELRDWMYIYKANSCWAMRYIGGNNIFAFNRIFKTIGCFSSNCVAPFSHRKGEFHCVFTGDNIIIHDGRDVVETLENRVMNEFSNRLSQEYPERSYIINVQRESENWICFPEGGHDYPNKALVWNYNDGTLNFRDLHGANWITQGLIVEDSAISSWDQATKDWDSSSRSWSLEGNIAKFIRPVEFHPQAATFDIGDSNVTLSSGMYESDEGEIYKDGDTEEPTYNQVSRTDLAILPNRQTKEPMFDLSARKIMKRARLQLSGGNVKVRLGAAEKVGGPVSWSTVTEVPNSDVISEVLVDKVMSGRSFAIEISSEGGVTPDATDDTSWELHGYQLDIEKVSDY